MPILSNGTVGMFVLKPILFKLYEIGLKFVMKKNRSMLHLYYMEKKVLILGASGMLGHVVALYLRENGYVVDTLVNHGSFDDQSLRINIMDKLAFEQFLTKSKGEYNYVINAAGILTKQSNSRKDLASYINGFLPHQLEYFFNNTTTKVIHYSTDCVFSGENGPYKEDALQDGDSFYDKSKALGEIINKKDLTLRQSIIGPDLNSEGIGLFNWLMSQKGQIRGYSRAIWNGLTTTELARATSVAMEQDLCGLYQLTPPEPITKYELLKLFNTTFEKRLVVLKDEHSMDLDKTLVNTRSDFDYEVPDYPTMINDMKKWIFDHEELYGHYKSQP